MLAGFSSGVEGIHQVWRSSNQNYGLQKIKANYLRQKKKKLLPNKMEMDKNIFALNMSYPEIQMMLLESSLIFAEQCSPVCLLYSQALLCGKQPLTHILPGS